MAAITAAILGGVTAATTMGLNFAEIAKNKGREQIAKEQKAKSMAEVNKMLSINTYKNLGIQKEPYELQRQALAQAGAQAMEAAKEEGRGLAATAGRVQMAQNEAQAGIRTAMGKEMTDIDKMVAEEESRLRDVKTQIALDEAAGASQAMADAAKAKQQAILQGVEGAVNLGSQIGQAIPLYQKTAGVRAENAYNKLAQSGKLGSQYLDASGKPLSFQQAMSIATNDATLNDLNQLDWSKFLESKNRKYFNNFDFSSVTGQ